MFDAAATTVAAMVEAAAQFVVQRQLGCKEFEGNRARQTRMPREIDAPHSAAAENPVNGVLREGLSEAAHDPIYRCGE
ncbi:hypothetical protein [Nocardia tengchongensis]